MIRTIFFSIAAFAAVAAIAGCNSGTNNPPAPGPTCSPPAGTQTALVYPAPNSTSIPDQFGQIIIGSSTALPSSWNVVVATVVSPQGVGGGTVQSAAPPFPTPNATPGFANPVYQSSSFQGITFGSEVVRVFLNNTGTNCTPLGPIGQFTTQ